MTCLLLFHVQFVNRMNTSYVQIRNELASQQLIKVQFQVAMSGCYKYSSFLDAYLVWFPFILLTAEDIDGDS